jgi:hypothetical protein
MREDRLLARAVTEPVIEDKHRVVHRVSNIRLVFEHVARHGYVENWQVRVACRPSASVDVTLEMERRAIDRAVLGDESRGDFVTCLACACGINIKMW